MKRIRVISVPTAGLGEYLDSVDRANWDEFRSHNAGTSLRELREVLARNQHGLCAYCEIEIKEPRRQIEHVIPRGDNRVGTQMALDVTNLVACCVGGTVAAAGLEDHEREDHYRRPVADNISCGQAKGDRSDNAFVDPRSLPAFPALTKVDDDGHIDVDEDACHTAGVAPDRVTRTIDVLNLNADRLRLARGKWRNDLIERSQYVHGTDRMIAWIRAVLTPDADGRLSRFFTTSRCYFGPAAERILDEQPQEWI